MLYVFVSGLTVIWQPGISEQCVDLLNKRGSNGING